MDRHDHAERRIDVFELLADETEADVVHPGAAVLLRDRTPKQAEVRHLRHNRRIEPMLAIELANPWRDLARRPVAHRLLEQPLLLCQVEIKHQTIP